VDFLVKESRHNFSYADKNGKRSSHSESMEALYRIFVLAHSLFAKASSSTMHQFTMTRQRPYTKNTIIDLQFLARWSIHMSICSI
jgi:hypothetical protein